MSPARTAVVSGGGTGIGRAIALALLDDGYDVAILGRRADILEDAAEDLRAEASSGRVTTWVADLTDPEATSATSQELLSEWGGSVDVVVANAGRPARRPDSELGSHRDVWVDAVVANTTPTVLLVEAMRPHLSDAGRLIFISSAAAVGPGGGAYGGAKAALHAWMYDLAAELGPSGTTCNVVVPGFIDDTDLFSGRLSDERRQGFVDRTLVKRSGVPRDVAACVRWLASVDAGYVTAQVIGVDGGALVDAG